MLQLYPGTIVRVLEYEYLSLYLEKCYPHNTRKFPYSTSTVDQFSAHLGKYWNLETCALKFSEASTEILDGMRTKGAH